MFKDYYEISYQKVYEGINICLDRLFNILDDIDILCQNSGSEASAALLYTIAIEEFGKSLILYENLEKDEIDKKIEINTNIFGRGVGSHDLKFMKAIYYLPEDCLNFFTINTEIELRGFPEKQKKMIKNHKKILNELRNKFPNIEIDSKISVGFDFETRKNLLYLDYDYETEDWITRLDTNTYYNKLLSFYGWNYDKKYNMYLKIEKNKASFKSHLMGFKEYGISEDKIFPYNLLLATKNFREVLHEFRCKLKNYKV